MEMEASRRSVLDRSREPGAKKPRLTEESERDRGPSAGVTSDRSRTYAQSRPAAGGSGGNPRFRASEREEREEVGRGGAPYQQQQELVAQYRTALAELTFNSKPIITNLTIIAGESLHVAKSIAATVCDNVLEVPSEQKLPSLYLLDSIVKNIGGDYIKYFAARLPQVFCKAYKQVDPSIHHSLRHLFGTWKGYFPTSCLQSIEHELGFQNVINGSSGGTGTRSDAQSQRSPHSIHVNPKYLEARQRFQQSTKGKEISSEGIDEVVAPLDDAERSIRNPLAGSTRQRSELSNKDVQHPQKEQPSDFINERKGYKDLRDPSFSSQLLRQQDVGVGRIGRVKDLDEMGRTVDQISESDEPSKPYYEAGGAAQSTAYRRNGFDANYTYGNYRTLGSAPNNSQVSSIHSNRTNWPLSKNWKTSEEEEYIWDDMGSRSVDYESASNKRNAVSVDDQDKPLSLQSHKWMSMETGQVGSRLNKFDTFHPRSKIVGTDDRIHFTRDLEERYSQQHSQEVEPRLNKGAWPPPLRDPPVPALGLDHKISRVSSQTEHRPTPLSDVLGSSGLLAQQGPLPLRSPSPNFPSIPSSPLQQHSLIDQDYLQVRSSQIGQKSSQLTDQFNRDAFSPGSHDSFTSLSENPAPKAHTSSNSHALLPLSSFPVISPHPELKQHPSIQETSATVSQPKGFSGTTQSNISNLLASVLKTDILPNKQASGLNMHPPLPSGPPPPQALTSPPLPTSSAQMASSHGISPSFTPFLPDGILPPLPPGPPPSTSLVGSTNSATIGLNPLSSLLSSLVAKGLITSASTNQMSKESSSQNSDLDPTTSTQQFSSKELPITESSSLNRVFFDDNLIGIQFKTEIIREFHPPVIDSILDNLKHRCVSCGLRFRHQHQLQSHSDWHSSNNSEMSSIEKVCRRWYSSINDWISGVVEPPCGPVPVETLESMPLEDSSEPMVTADERQCICALCGEPFEDFYSIERDEWMYKGTVYLNSADEKCVAGGIGNNILEGPIVHAKCISVSAVNGDVAGYC
ncbi:polyadenylation and cleavage factor homolog 4 isoform X2 [Phalaenopsis equestris]|uniref:polyadenylation and cleavage factor homolog 4 isoform X2 n=1 Tax=Phalaenopsis equestris TaxID=78828 RepID=UPI0009E3411B|nr:polyadenylation and cleavage factor homolog 4 isoform X2 [Phalaenopsis equestris]